MMRFQRRQRTTFTKQQLDALAEAFKGNHYPDADYREYLGKTINLDPSRIQVWFQNQRAKNRKRQGEKSPLPLLHQQHQPAPEPPVDITRSAIIAVDSLEVCHHSHSDPNRETNQQNLCPAQVVYVFDSSLANEAANAVSEGICEGIIEYHRKIYDNHATLQDHPFINAR